MREGRKKVEKKVGSNKEREARRKKEGRSQKNE
jgi:hypothetical protein